MQGKKKISAWGGGEQVGLGVVLLFLECSLCPIQTWQQWEDRSPGIVDSHCAGLFKQGPNEGQGGRGI